MKKYEYVSVFYVNIYAKITELLKHIPREY